MAYRTKDNTTNRPLSNCCDAKDPAQESEILNLKEVISSYIEKAAELWTPQLLQISESLRIIIEDL